MKKMTYEQIRPTLGTFDLVLFHGTGCISFLVGLFSWRYTHCGTIVKCSQEMLDFTYKRLKQPVLKLDTYEKMKVIGRSSGGVLMVFESTTLNNIKGVQLNLLSDEIKNYKGRISIRHLTTERTPARLEKFYKFISRTLGLPYEKHPLELLGAAIKLGEKKPDDSDYFCSELTADGYQETNLLPSDPPSNKYMPDDLREGRIMDRLLPVDAVLGSEIRIK